MPRTPIGFYDDPPPPDLQFVESQRVGRGRVAQLGRTLTRVTKEVDDFLDSLNPLD